MCASRFWMGLPARIYPAPNGSCPRLHLSQVPFRVDVCRERSLLLSSSSTQGEQEKRHTYRPAPLVSWFSISMNCAIQRQSKTKTRSACQSIKESAPSGTQAKENEEALEIELSQNNGMVWNQIEVLKIISTTIFPE